MKFNLLMLISLFYLMAFCSSTAHADDKRAWKTQPKNGYEYNVPSYSTRRIYGETRRYGPVYQDGGYHHFGHSGSPYSRYSYSAYSYSPYSYGTHSVSVNWGSGGLTIGRFVPSVYQGQFVSYPGYSTYPNYTQMDMYGRPLWYGQNPFNNNVLHNARRENDIRWNGPLDQINQQQQQKFIPNPVTKPFIVSTGPAKLKSIRAQAQGDVWFRKGKYSLAYKRYKKAIEYAEDQPRAHFRLAYSLVSTSNFERAVKHFKRGLYVDPTWPSRGESLDKIFGEENRLTKAAILSKATTWARKDIRDPDRLFLMGLLLYFDKDDRAGEFFATAYRLAGGGQHLQVFLNPQLPTDKKQTDKKQTGNQQANNAKNNPPVNVPQVGPVKLPVKIPSKKKTDIKKLPPLPTPNNTLPPLPSDDPEIDVKKLFPE